MRTLERLLFTLGIACLALFVFYTVEAQYYQYKLSSDFDEELKSYPPATSVPIPPPKLAEGDLVGRLSIPRLSLSVMVMEGVESSTLRVAAGHIPGTSFPGTDGNFAVA